MTQTPPPGHPQAVPPLMAPPPAATPPSGYISDKAKSSYTITVGLLGAAFFVAQMVLPFLVSFAVFPAMMFGQMTNLTMADLGSSAYWDGRVWYQSEQMGSPAFEPGARFGYNNTASLPTLYSVAPGQAGPPRSDGVVPFREAQLLGDGNRLWLIGPSEVAWYVDGTISRPTTTEHLSSVTRPFLYHGLPAVIEQRPGGYMLRTFDQEHWTTGPVFRIEPNRSVETLLADRIGAGDLRAVADGNTLCLLLHFGDQVFYRLGLPPDDAPWDAWQPVGPTWRFWSACPSPRGPVVFLTREPHAGGQIRGLRLEEGAWQPLADTRTGLLEGLGAFVGPEGQAVLLMQGFPGSLRSRVIRDGQETTVRHGKGFFPFSGGLMAMILLPQCISLCVPLVLAIVLTGVMTRHRVLSYRQDGQAAPYASVIRRALAQAIDALILGAPFLLAAWSFFHAFTGLEEGDVPVAFALAPFALILGGMVWALVWLVVFSATEGAYGTTPGKWVFGIRVMGTDLRPCGFGRALVRNLLKFVDGFFNFMVGILLVALTENWQRVGDLAARTIVVRKQPRSIADRPAGV